MRHMGKWAGCPRSLRWAVRTMPGIGRSFMVVVGLVWFPGYGERCMRGTVDVFLPDSGRMGSNKSEKMRNSCKTLGMRAL